MRRLYFSAAALCLSLLLPGAAQAALKPYQQAALERMLAAMEPDLRPLARPQLEQQLGMLNEAQIAMMVAGLEQAQAEQAVAPPEPEFAPVTEEDLAFNRAQYEPALRRLFEAQLAYDLLLTKLVGQGLPAEEYAVWGHGWRYEVPALTANWEKAVPDYEMFRMTYENMAPQDGRYRFDLPDIRTSFDEAAIKAAIAEAAQDYAAVGKRFKAEAAGLAAAEKFDALHALERRSGAEAEAIRARLEKLLAVHAPSKTAFVTALLQGTRQ